MDNKDIKMGQLLESWEGNNEDKKVKNITLCVTEDCNLACKYCYMTGKNHRKKMTFETAKKCIDYILSNREEFSEGSVVWDFIGGEPFLEIDLIDKVCDYIKMKMFMLDHPWFDSYRFSFSTNGLLYHTEKVQSFIKKNKSHLSIGISIDGNKTKHDLQRVYPSGKGSYDDVMKNVPLWLKQFPNESTKATFSHNDLPYLKDSIISLWNNGIKEVAANVIFEDVWQEGDDKILEKQLDELGDYILENKLWNEYYVRFFDPSIGNPLRKESLGRNFCGAGKMLAIDCDGNFFPCIRFVDFALEKRNGRCIGNVEKGINKDKLRTFDALTLQDQSKEECINCEVATGCAWCTGFNYDDSGSIYKRSTHICKLHKATVRANKRFWAKYEKLTGNPSLRREYENVEDKKYMLVMLQDDITPHCSYRNKKGTKNKMSMELIDRAMEFASENDFEIVFMGEKGETPIKNKGFYMSLVDSNSKEANKKSIVIYDNDVSKINKNSDTCILLINKDNIENITVYIRNLSKDHIRINLVLEDIGNWKQKHIELYKEELNSLVEVIEKTYVDNQPLEVNVITDRINFNSHNECTAGSKTITLAPNGEFYICPAFYYDDVEDSIGSLEEGILNKDECLLSIENAPICRKCDAYQCKACRYLNKKLTEEYNVSPKIQCNISHYEREATRKLQSKLVKRRLINAGSIIEKLEYVDPLDKILYEN